MNTEDEDGDEEGSNGWNVEKSIYLRRRKRVKMQMKISWKMDRFSTIDGDSGEGSKVQEDWFCIIFSILYLCIFYVNWTSKKKT